MRISAAVRSPAVDALGVICCAGPPLVESAERPALFGPMGLPTPTPGVLVARRPEGRDLDRLRPEQGAMRAFLSCMAREMTPERLRAKLHPAVLPPLEGPCASPQPSDLNQVLLRGVSKRASMPGAGQLGASGADPARWWQSIALGPCGWRAVFRREKRCVRF